MRAAVFAAIPCLLVGCAAVPYRLGPVETNAVNIEVIDGLRVVTSSRPNSVTRLLVSDRTADPNQPLRLYVHIKNISPTTQTALPESVTVSIGSERLSSVSWEAAATQATKEIDQRAFAGDLAAAFTAGQRAGSDHSSKFTAAATTTYLGGGAARTDVSGSISDAAARERALYQSEVDSRAGAVALRSESSRLRASIEATAFKGQSVAPGGTYSGALYFARPYRVAEQQYRVEISFAGDRHEFLLTERPASR